MLERGQTPGWGVYQCGARALCDITKEMIFRPACFSTNFLKSGARKRNKVWTFPISGEFMDGLETNWIFHNMGPLPTMRENEF